MMTAMLLFAPLMLAAPEAADPVYLGAPSILTGRRRGYAATEWEKLDQDISEGKPVPVQCKAFAPPIFSGRAKRTDCELEIVPPEVDTVAPAMFSGRSPKRGEVIVGARALQYYPAGAVGRTEAEAQEIVAQAAQEGSSGQVYMPAPAVAPKPRRRAPSIFSGRRARPAAAQ
jgi:hypothetical protein